MSGLKKHLLITGYHARQIDFVHQNSLPAKNSKCYNNNNNSSNSILFKMSTTLKTKQHTSSSKHLKNKLPLCSKNKANIVCF